MPLYLTEKDVEALLTPGEAVPVLEECFRRLAAGEVTAMPASACRSRAASSRCWPPPTPVWACPG